MLYRLEYFIHGCGFDIQEKLAGRSPKLLNQLCYSSHVCYFTHVKVVALFFITRLSGVSQDGVYRLGVGLWLSARTQHINCACVDR